MATDWDLIGGHPAPGSVEGVDEVVTAFTRVSTRVDSVRHGLRRAGGDVSIAEWRGDAADAFRARIDKLPAELDLISVSFGLGASALRTYAEALRTAQAEALRVGVAARLASDDAHRAERARNQAQADIDSVTGRVRAARRQRDHAQAQWASATDPATRATLLSGLESARAQVRRLESDLRSVTADRDRRERERLEAVDRLDRQRREAAAIRQRVREAASTAVAALRRAEKDAHLPSWLARTREDGRVRLVTYGPAVADSLDLGVTLFSAAAKILPAGAPVFLTFAAVLGSSAILINVAVMAGSPGGVTAERLIHLGGEAAGVLAAAVGLGAIGKGAAAAASLGRATTALGYAGDAADVAEAGAKDGWGGVERSLTGIVVGRAAGAVSAKVLKTTISGMNHNPTTAAWLTQASRAVKRAHTADVLGTHSIPGVDATGGTRAIQSMLAVGRIPPGGLLPAHDGAKLLTSHALGRAETDGVFAAVGETIPEEVGGLVDGRPVSWVVDQLTGGGHGSETDVDDGVEIILPMRTSRPIEGPR